MSSENQPMKLKIYIIFAIMLVAIASSWLAWMQERERMEAKFHSVSMRFEELAKEHKIAMETASKALAYRSQVNEEYKLRSLELEKALDSCPSLDSVILPDDIRLRFAPEKGNPDNAKVRSPK